jgi:hypothetical protein
MLSICVVLDLVISTAKKMKDGREGGRDREGGREGKGKE